MLLFDWLLILEQSSNTVTIKPFIISNSWNVSEILNGRMLSKWMMHLYSALLCRILHLKHQHQIWSPVSTVASMLWKSYPAQTQNAIWVLLRLYTTSMGYLLRAAATANNNYNENTKGNDVEYKARLNKVTHHLLLLKQWTWTGWEWLHCYICVSLSLRQHTTYWKSCLKWTSMVFCRNAYNNFNALMCDIAVCAC